MLKMENTFLNREMLHLSAFRSLPMCKMLGIENYGV
jgi:hypothetical protein